MLIHYIFFLGVLNAVFNQLYTQEERVIIREATTDVIRFTLSVVNSRIFIPQGETSDSCNDQTKSMQQDSCYVRWFYVCGPRIYTGPAVIRQSPFTILRSWREEMTDILCNRNVTHLLIKRQNRVLVNLTFNLEELGHNFFHSKFGSIDGTRHSLGVDVIKWCYNLRGFRCKVTCEAPSERHRCKNLDGKVACSYYYTGPDCANLKFRPCQLGYCSHSGTCIENGPEFECKCVPGFTGRYCHQRTGEITSCFNGVTLNGEKCLCINNSNPPFCTDQGCPPNYCQNGGVCFTSQAAFMCKCTKNFAGVRCQHRCFRDCGNGVCVLLNGQPTCECHKYYSGIDCKTPLTPIYDVQRECLHKGATQRGNYLLGYICLCRQEWTGYSCEQPACTKKNCINGVCALGNKMCYCATGYTGEECNFLGCNAFDICQNQGICVQASRYDVRCACPNGFTGKFCEQECIGGCGPAGVCVSSLSGYECQCDANHEGPNCEQLRSSANCGKFTCQNGGSCVEGFDNTNPTISAKSFTCRCTPYWTGPSCSISSCNTSTCLNGQCLLDVGCVCNTGFDGTSCERAACTPGFCLNGGECTSLERTHQCVCNPSVSSGPRCENVCPGGCFRGECVTAATGEAVCRCINGFSGRSCLFENLSLRLTYGAAGVLGFAIIFMLCGLGVFAYSKLYFKKSENIYAPQVEIDSPYLYQGL